MIITENGNTIYLVRDGAIQKQVFNREEYDKISEPLRRKFREMQDARSDKKITR